MNALTSPTDWTAAPTKPRPSFAAEVYAATGLTPEEAAQSSLYTEILIDCWHRASSGQEAAR